VVGALNRIGARPVLLGRREPTLADTARCHNSAGVRVAALDDPAALRDCLRDCRVIVNCASPASRSAVPLLEAALDTGTHYADPCGEQAHIRRLFDEWDALARARRIVVVPALGFDYSLGDCLAHIAARGCEPATQVLVAYSVQGAGVQAASAQFAGETSGGGEVVYRNGRWQPVPFELDAARFAFPGSAERVRMARYGAGEVITVPRHVRTGAVVALITANSLCPAWLLPAFPVLRPIVGFARQTPLRGLLRLASRLSQPARGKPAAVEAQQHGGEDRFTIAVEVRGANGSIGRGAIEGRDFHGVTAATIAYGARSLARGAPARFGTLAPAQALSPPDLLDHLASHGLRWQVTPPG
jgi:short subunit dehydrogenase-like uncharacterized protein